MFSGFPVKQYFKALNGVQKLLASEDAPLDLILMCSLLFIHFEAVRENFALALLHAENAIRVVTSKAGAKDGGLDPSLVRALMRVDLQGSIWLGMRAPGEYNYREQLCLVPNIPLRSSQHIPADLFTRI